MVGISLKCCISCISVLLADRLITICKVIFIRMFQNDMLISNMAQVSTSQYELCNLCYKQASNNACVDNRRVNIKSSVVIRVSRVSRLYVYLGCHASVSTQ
jgi:hypothetical protein